ncbi:CP family cyanate transporter-like MFS transporter [Paenarthrobacter nicotinovorans]|uniref:MFS transporter n=1 Tax=Paenarthrobacter nicotinovorans TaxID=29320 RepID=UPI002783ADCF|nr:MFS transporter [Paenarthrobacter nicotinovorans]MDP9937364.1 CP family cyanate transporter-like MFS transporter [Paenarthrobacter nicotinovorans]
MATTTPLTTTGNIPTISPAGAAPSAANTGAKAPKSRVVVVVGVIAVVLIGLNLRAGITSAAALFHELQQFLGYGALVASILPSIPLLCFAVAGLGTSWLTRRVGVEKAIFIALALLASGLLVRGVPATGALLGGTVLAMSGLAVCNVAMPSLIREHYSDRTSMMTGVYTFTMSGGATFAAAVSVPLAQQLGSPSMGLAAWGLLGVAALLGFLPVVLHSHRNSAKTDRPRVSMWPLLKTRLGLLITAIFTFQAFLAYAVMSWFAYILTSEGLSASESGLQFGVMQLVSVAAGMILLTIGSRPGMLRPALYLASSSTLVAIGTMLWLPTSLAVVPAILFGFGLGIFPLVLVIISRSGGSTAETTALSTIAQSLGYLIAAIGPFGMGLLHSATGGWVLPLSLLSIVAVALMVTCHLLTSKRTASKTHPRTA